MPKFIGLMLTFFMMLVIAFFAIGYSSTVDAPDNSTAAGQQYENLTKTTDITFTGINAVLLLFIIGIVITAIILLAKAVKV